MIFSQTTEMDKYRYAVATLAPQTIRQNIQMYKYNRAIVLGLPMGFQTPSGVQQVQQAEVKLQDRLASYGTALAATLAWNGAHKEFIESVALAAVKQLGGWDKIYPNGEWGFLLEDCRRDEKGSILDFGLPSVPFKFVAPASLPGQQPKTYDVDIILAEDGSGRATFSIAGQSENTTPQNNDPL